MPAKDAQARSRVIDAASDLFARNGFRSTPVDAIAAEAGVSRSLVFWHFESKEQLLWAVATESLRRWIGELRESTSDLRGLAALHHHMALRKAVIAEEAAGIRLIYLLMGEAIGTGDGMADGIDQLRDLYGEVREMMVRWIAEAVEDGEIAPVDPHRVGLVTYAALTGTDSLRFIEGDHFDADAADAGLLALLGVEAKSAPRLAKVKAPATKVRKGRS